jgi:SGNH hydrolase-like domain, acetyltransferase AlgX
MSEVRRSTRWIANGALVLASTLLSLAAIEIGMRITGAVPPSVYEADSTLIYRPVAGGTKNFVHNAANGGATVRVRINDDGFRGPPLRTDGTARRVAVYGDSFIAGEFAPDSLTFVRMLEGELSRRTPTEVVNAGVTGYGPDQEFLRMQRELPRLKPQVVVLAVFADNDFGDLVRNRLFRLRPDSTLEAHRVALHPILENTLTTQAHPSGLRRLRLVRWVERKRRRVTENLPTTRPRKNEPTFSIAGYSAWAMFNAQRQYGDTRANPDTVLDLLGDSYDIDVSATPDSSSARYKVALMDRLLGAIQQDMQARAVPLVLVIIPSPIDACESYDIRVDTARYPGYERRRISGTIDSLAARHGIRRVDLWAPFRAANACDLYYRGGDLHWKENGQRMAARLVADSLTAWKLAP